MICAGTYSLSPSMGSLNTNNCSCNQPFRIYYSKTNYIFSSVGERVKPKSIFIKFPGFFQKKDTVPTQNLYLLKTASIFKLQCLFLRSNCYVHIIRRREHDVNSVNKLEVYDILLFSCKRPLTATLLSTVFQTLLFYFTKLEVFCFYVLPHFLL